MRAIGRFAIAAALVADALTGAGIATVLPSAAVDVAVDLTATALYIGRNRAYPHHPGPGSTLVYRPVRGLGV